MKGGKKLKEIKSSLKHSNTRFVTDANLDDIKYYPEMNSEQENMEKYAKKLGNINKIKNLKNHHNLSLLEKQTDSMFRGYKTPVRRNLQVGKTPQYKTKNVSKMFKRSNTESKFTTRMGHKSSGGGMKSKRKRKAQRPKKHGRYTTRDQTSTYNFFNRLNSKFSHIEASQTTKTGLASNRINTMVRKGLLELVEDPDCNQKLQRRALIVGNKRSTKLVKKDRFITDAEIEKKQFQKKTGLYLESKLPKLKKRIIFDCASVSPAVNKLLGNTKLPVDTKQMRMSSYQA